MLEPPAPPPPKLNAIAPTAAAACAECATTTPRRCISTPRRRHLARPLTGEARRAALCAARATLRGDNAAWREGCVAHGCSSALPATPGQSAGSREGAYVYAHARRLASLARDFRARVRDLAGGACSRRRLVGGVHPATLEGARGRAIPPPRRATKGGYARRQVLPCCAAAAAGAGTGARGAGTSAPWAEATRFTNLKLSVLILKFFKYTPNCKHRSSIPRR